MFGRKRTPPAGGPPPDPDELYQRAKAAGRTRGPQDEQEGLLRQAAEQGHKVAMFDLGGLLQRQHRVDEARTWFARAHDAGHILAQKSLDALPAEDPSEDPELVRLREEAEYGEPEAMTSYGKRLWGMGQRAPAAEWLRRAADAGHRPAVRELAFVVKHEPGEQERLLRLDAQHGDLEGLRPLADHLRSHHHPDAAEVHQQLVALGDPWAAYQLGEIFQREGNVEQALHWYRTAQDSPESARSARGGLGRLLAELGRHTEAEPYLRDAGGQGDFHLAWILECRGEYAEAEELYRDLAELDIKNTDAAAGLARMLERRGELDEARPWREESEAAGASPEGPDWPH